MAASGTTLLKAVTSNAGSSAVKIKRALVSVFDKAGVVDFARELSGMGVVLLSTGGTKRKIAEAGIPVTDVTEYTGAPEILDGRVKTLHPKVHGALLAVRGNESHEKQMKEQGIEGIDLVVCNLYPFADAVGKGGDYDTCIENIDIGGPCMIRASAKNHRAVTTVTSPGQYAELLEHLKANDGAVDFKIRRRFAARAFAVTAAYDAAISEWAAAQVDAAEKEEEEEQGAAASGAGSSSSSSGGGALSLPSTSHRVYSTEFQLKYGCNPHQKLAFVAAPAGGSLPFKVVNGRPGYINLLDAVNAWALVVELRQALGKPAATSFKHVSPAGAAIAAPLTDVLAQAYEAVGKELTPLATAYLRARNADPMSSFGDFVAVSEVVDEATARILKPEVSDGIIAPGFEPAALEILSAKKGGNFIVLQGDVASVGKGGLEYRELGGAVFAQERNTRVFSKEDMTGVGKEATGAGKEGGPGALPEGAVDDLVLASVAVKYTQSNSVGYAQGGQMVGIGAGQQSRVDCVKLAGRKVKTWFLRQHPKVLALPFKKGTKRQDRVNARVRYIEGDFTPAEYEQWKAMFDSEPEPLTDAERAEFVKTLDGVTLASDAFFPFRDSIDIAAQLGVKFVAQPGGSRADSDVVKTAEEYGMRMVFHGVRAFHH